MRIGRNEWTWALCALFIIALIYSRFLLSVSMFGLAIVGLLDWTHKDGKWSIQWNPIFVHNLRRFGFQPEYGVVTLFFFVVLWSGWQTEDWEYWMGRLRIKLPFLILPLAFLGLPVLLQKQYFSLMYFLIIVLSITCIGIGINYLLHFETITASIKHGKSIPTPCNHIRFSLLLSLGILGGGWLSWKHYFWRFPWEKWLIRGMTLFLFGFIFLLSVRSGLVALYGGLFILLIYYVSATRSYWKAGIISLGLCAMPVIAYLTFPSFHAKMGYVQEDMRMQEQDKAQNYSDSGRFTSIEMGMEIAEDHPILGVGAGNLRQEVAEIYAKEFPKAREIKLPHNQFVWVLAANGIIGLLLFSVAFFYPLLHHSNYRQPVFLAFNVVIFSSFLTESTLETSLGVALYLFFLLLGLNYIRQYCPQTKVRSVYEPLRREPNLVR